MTKMIKIKNIDKDMSMPTSLFHRIIWKKRLDDAFRTGSTVENLKLITRELKRYKQVN